MAIFDISLKLGMWQYVDSISPNFCGKIIFPPIFFLPREVFKIEKKEAIFSKKHHNNII
jgi:hypothetical protein